MGDKELSLDELLDTVLGEDSENMETREDSYHIRKGACIREDLVNFDELFSSTFGMIMEDYVPLTNLFDEQISKNPDYYDLFDLINEAFTRDEEFNKRALSLLLDPLDVGESFLEYNSWTEYVNCDNKSPIAFRHKLDGWFASKLPLKQFYLRMMDYLDKGNLEFVVNSYRTIFDKIKHTCETLDALSKQSLDVVLGNIWHVRNIGGLQELEATFNAVELLSEMAEQGRKKDVDYWKSMFELDEFERNSRVRTLEIVAELGKTIYLDMEDKEFKRYLFEFEKIIHPAIKSIDEDAKPFFSRIISDYFEIIRGDIKEAFDIISETKKKVKGYYKERSLSCFGDEDREVVEIQERAAGAMYFNFMVASELKSLYETFMDESLDTIIKLHGYDGGNFKFALPISKEARIHLKSEENIRDFNEIRFKVKHYRVPKFRQEYLDVDWNVLGKHFLGEFEPSFRCAFDLRVWTPNGTNLWMDYIEMQKSILVLLGYRPLNENHSDLFEDNNCQTHFERESSLVVETPEVILNNIAEMGMRSDVFYLYQLMNLEPGQDHSFRELCKEDSELIRQFSEHSLRGLTLYEYYQISQIYDQAPEEIFKIKILSELPISERERIFFLKHNLNQMFKSKDRRYFAVEYAQDLSRLVHELVRYERDQVEGIFEIVVRSLGYSGYSHRTPQDVFEQQVEDALLLRSLSNNISAEEIISHMDHFGCRFYKYQEQLRTLFEIEPDLSFENVESFCVALDKDILDLDNPAIIDRINRVWDYSVKKRESKETVQNEILSQLSLKIFIKDGEDSYRLRTDDDGLFNEVDLVSLGRLWYSSFESCRLFAKSGYSFEKIEMVEEWRKPIEDMLDVCNPEVVIDYGCGHGLKGISVVDYLDRNTQYKSYYTNLVFTDAQDIFLKQATAHAIKHVKNHDFSTLKIDLQNLDSELNDFCGYGKKLVLFLGQTLGNMPNQQNVLERLRNNLSDGDYLLVEVDVKKDMAIYENTDFQRRFLSLSGIPEEVIEAQVETDEVGNVNTYFVLKEDYDMFGCDCVFGGIEVSSRPLLRKGLRFHTGYSAKFNVDSLDDRLNNIGFKRVKGKAVGMHYYGLYRVNFEG